MTNMIDDQEIKIHTEALQKAVPDPSAGLPDDIFYYISRTTPLVNVDLLIKDENGRTLLAWRDDCHTGVGWHVPGGIVRFKETLEERIVRVAECEIGMAVEFDSAPIALNQTINSQRDVRGHFISLLYKCFLASTFKPMNENILPGRAGYLMWHDGCPENLLQIQHMYRVFVDNDL